MDTEQNASMKQIAVVGGGFAGCSTAYFLRSLIGSSLGIRIFERSDRVGGRVRAIEYNDGKELYETGASVFSKNHRYMNRFAKTFGLELQQLPPPDGALALYNGPLFKCSFSSNAGPLYINRIRLSILYGFDLIRFQRGVKKYVKDFSKIYERQNNKESFDHPINMLAAISSKFVPMLTMQFAKWLDVSLNLSDRFCKEFVYGIVSNCYCSDLTLHAFAGMVAVSDFGAPLYSIVGGNEQIAQRLASEALKSNPPGISHEVSLNTTVTKISTGTKRRYRLTYKEADGGGREMSEEFDYVVLAFPIHEAAETRLEVDEQISNALPSPKPYMEVDFTHFHGELAASQFGLPENKVQDFGHNGVTILPTQKGYEEERGTLFKYLGRAWSTAPSSGSGKPIGCWSAFSLPNRTPEPSKQIPQAYSLSNRCGVNSKRWHAYPIFSVVKEADLFTSYRKFILADGLIYVNEIERIASNMEMALIGGCNAALLIAKDQASINNL